MPANGNASQGPGAFGKGPGLGDRSVRHGYEDGCTGDWTSTIVADGAAQGPGVSRLHFHRNDSREDARDVMRDDIANRPECLDTPGCIPRHRYGDGQERTGSQCQAPRLVGHDWMAHDPD